MKRFFAFYTTVFALNLFVVLYIQHFTQTLPLQRQDIEAYFVLAGVKKIAIKDKLEPQIDYASVGGEDVVINPELDFNNFSSISIVSTDLTSKKISSVSDQLIIYADTDLSTIKVDEDMIYETAFFELPLFPQDYYWGKYENAVAGAKQLNRMPIVHAGDSIGIIRNRYLNVSGNAGYIQPPHYYFGSGVCWASSSLGATLDQANAQFKAKYGLDLFTYRGGDRAPHGGYYLTYTNNHRGYTILQAGYGNPVQDYRFTVNPAIKNRPELADIKVKIVFLYTDNHTKASHGQSIAAYLITNKEF